MLSEPFSTREMLTAPTSNLTHTLKLWFKLFPLPKLNIKQEYVKVAACADELKHSMNGHDKLAFQLMEYISRNVMTSKCLLLQRGTLLDIAQYETEGIATNDLTTWILHRWIATTSITAMHWTCLSRVQKHVQGSLT